VRSTMYTVNLTGAQGMAMLVGKGGQFDLAHTAGTVNAAIHDQAYIRLGRLGSSTGNVSLVRGYDFHVANEGSGDITTAINYMAGDVDLLDGTGKIGTIIGFRAANLGHQSRITGAAVGFDVANMTGGPQLTVGYRSFMAAGPNKWSMYFAGTANGLHVGKLRIGQPAVPTAQLDVGGAVAAEVFKFQNGMAIYAGSGVPSFAATQGSLFLSNTSTYRNADGANSWTAL
jgi:hypothetical protein